MPESLTHAERVGPERVEAPGTKADTVEDDVDPLVEIPPRCASTIRFSRPDRAG